MLQMDGGSGATESAHSLSPNFAVTDGDTATLIQQLIFMTKTCKKRRNAHGFQPRSCGFTYRMPALETVAGVAVRR